MGYLLLLFYFYYCILDGWTSFWRYRDLKEKIGFLAQFKLLNVREIENKKEQPQIRLKDKWQAERTYLQQYIVLRKIVKTLKR